MQENLNRQIEATQEYLDALRQYAQEEPGLDDRLNEAVEGFAVVLEELYVAQEELRQQNDELVATRELIEVECQRYRALFDLAPDAYLVTDREGIILEANRAALSLLNVPEKFLIGKPLAIFMPGEDQKTLVDLLASLETGREIAGREWEIHLQPRERAQVPGALTTSPILDADGRLAGVRWLVRALAAARRDEEREWLLGQIAQDREAIGKLAENLEHERDILETIMENTHAQLAYLDRDFNFVRVNSAYAQGAGCAEEELIGCNHFDLFPNPENEAIFEGVRDIGQPVRYRAKPFEYLDQPERGITYWDWTLVPVRDAQGQVQGLVFSLLDVTEAERAKQERERYLARLNRLIQVSQEILAESTAKGVLQHTVDAARELTQANLAVAGHALEGDAFRLGVASQSGSLAPCPPAEARGAQNGGVYLDLLQDKASMRLTDSQLKNHPAWGGLPPEHVPLQGLLAARLVDRDGRPGGIVMASHKESGEFTAEDEALLAQLAALASLGLQHIEARDDAERQAEELSTIFRAMTDAVVVCDASGNVVQANPAAARAYGLDPLEADHATILGERLRQTPGQASGVAHEGIPIHKLAKRYPNGRGVAGTQLPSTRSLQGERVENEIYSLTTVSGEERTVLVSAAPLGAAGQISGAVLAWHDITEREAARREVDRLAARDRAILDSMTEGLIVLDLEGNIVDMNPAALRIHRFERLEEAQRHLFGYAELFETFTLDGQPLPVEEWPAARVLRGERFSGCELEVRRLDTGHRFVGSYSGNAVLDKEGRRILGIVTVHDITGERAAEAERERVERTRDRLIAILESTPDIVSTTSTTGEIFYLNRAGRELLGIPEGVALQGRNMRDYHPAWARRLVGKQGIPRVMEQEIWRGETAFTGADGREIPVSQVIIAHKGADGSVAFLSSVSRDVSERKRNLQQLEAERARFKAVIDNAPEAIAVTDVEGRIVMANAAAERLFGRPVPFGEEFELHAGLALCDPEGKPYDPRDLPLTRSALDGEAFRDVEMSMCRPGGQKQDLLVSSAPIRAARGRIAGAVGIFQDVTERKEIQRALRRYAERLRILHGIDQVILSAQSVDEIADGVLRSVRQLVPSIRASVVLFDVEAGEARILAMQADGSTRLGKGWHGPLEPDWPLEELGQGRAHAVKDTQSMPATLPLGQILRDEGVRAYVNVPLLAQGQLIGALNLGLDHPDTLATEQMDVVEEMAAELAIGIRQMRLNEQVQRHADEMEDLVARRTVALRASEARLRAIFEGAGIGIALADVKGRILQTNPALDKMLGYGEGELLGKIFAEFTHPEDVGVSVDTYTELIRAGRADYTMEKRYVRKDGVTIWANLNVSLVRGSSGEPLYAVGMVEDVTERKRIQAALLSAEKLAIAGRMGASLAHEINNPLQSVIGCLGLAEKTLPEGADAGRYLGVARQELRRAARIVSQLRDMSRPSVGETKEAVDLNALLEEVLVLSRKQAQERRVEVRWEPAEALPAVQAAPDRLRQVFLNLVLNAFDAMPEGGQLRVRTEASGSPAGVRAALTDTGVGIPQEALPKLFDPFYSTKSQGLGLGLYISHNIVEEHGGHIDVTSRLGEGTTFAVWLPA